MSEIVWLHLSDLHTCEKRTGWDAARVLRMLREDLVRMDASGLRPDLIFFTGDLVFGEVKEISMREQFDDAQRFLEGVRESFTPTVAQDRLFIVPGNHDVMRSEELPALTEWLDGSATVESVARMMREVDRHWEACMRRLGDYRTFLETYGYDHLLADPERLIYAVKLAINERIVGVAGFNSAWSCCRDGENGRLWMGGKYQTAKLVSDLSDVDISIALVHHPCNWFVEHEARQIQRQIERDFDFCLHGHEHDDWVFENAHGHVRIAAAACYESSDQRNGYNFASFCIDSGAGKVWLREYDERGGTWKPCIVGGKTDNDGRWPVGQAAASETPTVDRLHTLLGFSPSSTFGRRLLEVSSDAKQTIARYCVDSDFWDTNDIAFVESGTLPVFMFLELCRQQAPLTAPSVITNNVACAVVAMMVRDPRREKEVLYPEEVPINVFLVGGRVFDDYAATIPDELIDDATSVGEYQGCDFVRLLGSEQVTHVIMMTSRLTPRDGPCAVSKPVRRFKKLLLRYVLENERARLSILGEAEKLVEREGEPAASVTLRGDKSSSYWTKLLRSGRLSVIAAVSPAMEEAKVDFAKQRMSELRDAGAACVLLDCQGRPFKLDGE